MTYYLDDLLGKVDSRFTLAMLSAKRARQVTDYFNAIRKHEYTEIPGPDINRINEKPLSTAFEEIAEGIVVPEYYRDEASDEDQGEA